MKINLLLLTFLSVNLSILFGQPVNDDLCNATPITINADCMGIPNILPELATLQMNEPDITCAGTANDTIAYNSVWFSFVAPIGEVFILAAPDDATISNSYVMSLYTLTGDCTDFANLELQNCNTPQQNLFTSPTMQTTLTEGETYYLRVSGRTPLFMPETFSSTGCLSIIEVDSNLPANDDVCNAIDLTVNGDAQVYSNIGATSQLGEFPLSPPPSLSSPLAVFNDGWAPATNFLDNSVWFTFTTSANGGNYSIDLTGTTNLGGNFNTQVAVYEATDCSDFTSFTLLEAGDNSFPPGVPVNAHTTLDLFCLPANTTYHVVVDGGASFLFMPVTNQGYFSIQVTEPDPIPLSVNKFINAPDCVGGSDGTVFTIAEGGAGEYTYVWSSGDSIPELVNALSTGTYTLTVTDRCEESIVDTIVIPESVFEPLVATATDDVAACMGEEVEVSASGAGGVYFDTKRVFAQKSVDFGTYRLLATEMQRPEQQDTISSMQSVQFNELEFAGDDLYGVTFSQHLYQINPSTGETTFIDSIPVEAVRDLSYVPSDDKLYCLSGDGEILDLDPVTAAITNVSTITGIDGIGAAAIDDSGTMYVSSFSGMLYAVDITTGTSTLIGDFSIGASIALRALEIDHTDGSLYATLSVTLQPGSTSPWQETREISKTTGETLQRYRDFSASGPNLSLAIKPRTVDPYEYLWESITGISDPSLTSVTFPVSQTTTATVVVSDACVDNSSASVVATLLPDASTTIDTTFLEGGMYDGVVYNDDAVLMETYMASNGCDSLVTVNITVTTVGTEEKWADEAIQISPNPVVDQLNITTEGILETEVVVYVRDIYGRTLLQGALTTERMLLDVSGLQNGYYFLEIRSAEKYGVKRFLKM